MMHRKALLNGKPNQKNHPLSNQLKARTGIEGFDEITNGGLPCGRTTLLKGGHGSGKTVMALETLVTDARGGSNPRVAKGRRQVTTT